MDKPIIKRKQNNNKEKSLLCSIQTEPPKFQLGRIQTLVPEWLRKKWELGERQTEGLKLPKPSLGNLKTEVPWKKKPTKQKEDAYTWLRVVPRDGDKYENSKLLKLLSSADNSAFCWRYYCDETGKLQIHMGCQPKSVVAVKKAIETVFGQVDMEELNDDIMFDVAAEGYLKRVGSLGKGLKTKADKAIEDLMLNLKDGVCSVTITFSKASETERKQMLRSELSDKEYGRSNADESIWDVLKPWKQESKQKSKAAKSIAQKESVEQKAKRKAIEQELLTSELYFNVQIHIQASGEHAKSIVSSVAGVIDTSLRDGHRLILDNQADGKMVRRGTKGTFAAKDVPLWKESELLTIVGLPDMTHRVAKRIPSLKVGQQRLQDDEFAEGVAIGRIHHPLQQGRLVKIPTKQFLRHFFLGGKNGSGKSSTAVQMIQSLIDEWIADPSRASGFTYIDPARSTLMIILNRLLHAEQQGARVPWEKVHYFYLGKTDYPIGLNMLHKNGDEENAEVAENILALLHTAYSGETTFTDRLIENALRTLLSDRKTHSILGMIPLLLNPAAKEKIPVNDPLVQEFWETTGSELKDKDVSPLQNRLRPLLASETMRRVFGQKAWTPNIWTWMEDGHIVLIDLLNVKPMNVTLGAGLLLNHYHATAKLRKPDVSKPHVLMIDEAHLVQIPVLNKVIAEDRKFGLSLGLITQFPEQFNRDILKSITENMGTFLTCTVGPDSAAITSKMMNNAFTPHDLQDLATNVVAVYTQTQNAQGETIKVAMKVKSDPPIIYLPSGPVAKYESHAEMTEAQDWAVRKSQELIKRDCRHKDEIDEEIMNYYEEMNEGRYEKKGKENTVAKDEDIPTEEIDILKAIVQLVKNEGTFKGKTSELYDLLSDTIELDMTVNKFGLLLNKGEDWLVDQGIEMTKTHTKQGSILTLRLVEFPI